MPNPPSLEVVSDNTNLTVDSGFKNPYTDQYIFGYDQELFTNFGLQLNYVYKRGEDYGGWNDIGGSYVTTPYVDSIGADASGQTYTLFRLTSPASSRLFRADQSRPLVQPLQGICDPGPETNVKPLAAHGLRRVLEVRRAPG